MTTQKSSDFNTVKKCLSYTSIKDFAYEEDSPSHYGVFPVKKSLQSENVKQAVAVFSFFPENDNELRLEEGQIVIINYMYGQGWLVASDPLSGETGLIPEEYVEFLEEEEELIEEEPQEYQQYHRENERDNYAEGDAEDEARPYLPEILEHRLSLDDSDWEDEE